MSKFIATCDFVNSDVGSVKTGDELPDNSKVRDLCVMGYVREYKTKVVQQKPRKPRKKRTKKVK